MTDASFEQFVRSSAPAAIRLAHGYLGDWEEARDAVQEAFIKAHAKLASVKGEEAFTAWFYRLLTNHLKDRLRRRKLKNFIGSIFGAGEKEIETPDPSPGPEGAFVAASMKSGILREVDALAARQREVFRLKALTGMTFAEIASALSISEGAAKTHYSRAVDHLRRTLSDWRDEA